MVSPSVISYQLSVISYILWAILLYSPQKYLHLYLSKKRKISLDLKVQLDYIFFRHILLII
ncbi:hypothetical protein PN36_13240 [Candidatus Thiomargarita nelsonii]|uniref:Uncharacterized protein n=1 Tax=Candidatus Thiomargarita nelsonii TaxID=1003181 RepID=A0A4E0QQK0_9GAMM|nr:hypothetical protein PN36_13240 [Candidatus Thiomargarita nelsonii]